jgi:predicted DNA repair protein MutK
MAFTLLALLDDVVSVLDDVAVMSKMAAQKTAGVLGDDLALTARQVFGLKAQRELPVIISVAKGSLINKLILVPVAVILSRLAPWSIGPLLMIGGAWLCLEGAEKVIHFAEHLRNRKKKQTGAGSGSSQAHEGSLSSESLSQPLDAAQEAALEKKRISGAVRTDFVLSTEIIVITLGSVPPETTLAVRTAILAVVGLIMTVGVYGVVGAIVKIDDLGFWLQERRPEGDWLGKMGGLLVGAAPKLMRLLSVVGTAAMFLVGGGILAHAIWPQLPPEATSAVGNFGRSIAIGLITGLVLTPVAKFFKILKEKVKKNRSVSL